LRPPSRQRAELCPGREKRIALPEFRIGAKRDDAAAEFLEKWPELLSARHGRLLLPGFRFGDELVLLLPLFLSSFFIVLSIFILPFSPALDVLSDRFGDALFFSRNAAPWPRVFARAPLPVPESSPARPRGACRVLSAAESGRFSNR